MILDVQEYAFLPRNGRGGTVTISMKTMLIIFSSIFDLSVFAVALDLVLNNNVFYVNFSEHDRHTRIKKNFL